MQLYVTLYANIRKTYLILLLLILFAILFETNFVALGIQNHLNLQYILKFNFLNFFLDNQKQAKFAKAVL